jgi:hypothetical protein
MNNDWFGVIGDIAEALGVGEDAKRALGAYAEGRSTQTDGRDAPTFFVYERVLTRPRDPGVNDR